MDLESAGFQREHYHLYKVFKFPTPSGGKNAIAIPKRHEITIISAYTVLVAGAFLAWWILIAMLIPFMVPKHWREHEPLRTFMASEVSEPFQTAFVMAKFCWRARVPGRFSFRSMANISNLVRREGPSALILTSRANSRPAISRLPNIFIGLGILLLAIATAAGGIAGEVFLPGKLIIGNVAPVNSRMVFTPRTLTDEVEIEVNSVKVGLGVIKKRGAVRALSTVDSALFNSHLDNRVSVGTYNTRKENYSEPEQLIVQDEAEVTSQKPTTPKQTIHEYQDAYNISYQFSVEGHEMGLQHLTGLRLWVGGDCYFRFDWGSGFTMAQTGLRRGKLVDVRTIYKDERPQQFSHTWGLSESSPYFTGDTRFAANSSLRFVLFPGNQNARAIPTIRNITSLDPWYTINTDKGSGGKRIDTVVPYRPALDCTEWAKWYYWDNYLGPRLAETNNNLYPNFTKMALPGGPDLPEAIWKILSQHPYTAYVQTMFDAVPGGALESSTRWVQFNNVQYLDVDYCTAYRDIRRLARAAYVYARNTFRQAALAYVDPEWIDLSGPDVTFQLNSTNQTISLNALRDQENNTVSGSGEFVVPSDAVTTLRLEAVVAVPSVVAFSWLVVFIAKWLQPRPEGVAYSRVVADCVM